MEREIQSIEVGYSDQFTTEIEFHVNGERLSVGTLVRGRWGLEVERVKPRLMRVLAALAFHAAHRPGVWISADEFSLYVDGPDYSLPAFTKFMERSLGRYLRNAPAELHPLHASQIPRKTALVQYRPLRRTEWGWEGGPRGGFYRLNAPERLRVNVDACLAHLVGRRMGLLRVGSIPTTPENSLADSRLAYDGGDLLSARLHAQEALVACVQLPRARTSKLEETVLLASALDQLGRMEMYLGASANALSFGMAAQRLFHAAADVVGRSRSFGLIADAHIQMGAAQAALRSARAARDLASRARLNGNVAVWAACMGALGQMESERGNFRSARKHLETAYRLHCDRNGAPGWAAVYAARLVQNSLRARDLREAETHRTALHEALTAAYRIDPPDVPTRALVARVDAHFFLEINDRETAVNRLLEARRIGGLHGMANHIRRLIALERQYAVVLPPEPNP